MAINSSSSSSSSEGMVKLKNIEIDLVDYYTSYYECLNRKENKFRRLRDI